MSKSNITIPNYPYVFSFELEHHDQDAQLWLDRNWANIFYCIALYLVLIFGGQVLMRGRKPFNLRNALTLWSASLAFFSMIGASRTAPELITMLTHHSLYDTVCTHVEENSVARFWSWMFVLSKLPELGDTVFIVLRKQPLTFLHWYHHISVLLFCWFSYKQTTACTRWYIVMNYSVHSIMYTYYALKAKGFKLPRQLAVLITSLQLVQMSVGCLINLWLLSILTQDKECVVAPINVKFALAMYASYLVLFGNFFCKSYLSAGKRKDVKKRKKVA